jgi:hypothetical protein
MLLFPGWYERVAQCYIDTGMAEANGLPTLVLLPGLDGTGSAGCVSSAILVSFLSLYRQ